MITLGIDVAILAFIGIACMLLVIVFCATAGVTQEQGEAAVVASAMTALVMVIGYVVMARVLDMIVLYVY